MNDGMPRLGRLGRIAVGFTLALIVTVAAPFVAQAQWGSSASASLPVQMATLSADMGTPAIVDSRYSESGGSYSGTVIAAFPVEAPEGSIAWQTPEVETEVSTGSLGGAHVASIEYAVTGGSAECDSVRSWAAALSDVVPDALEEVAGGQSRALCVRYDFADLTSASNGLTVEVSMSLSVFSSGWTVTVPAKTLMIPLPVVPVPVPVHAPALECESFGAEVVLYEPTGRTGTPAVRVGSPTGTQLENVLYSTGEGALIMAADLHAAAAGATGTVTVYFVDRGDHSVWGVAEIHFDGGSGTFLCVEDV